MLSVYEQDILLDKRQKMKFKLWPLNSKRKEGRRRGDKTGHK